VVAVEGREKIPPCKTPILQKRGTPPHHIRPNPYTAFAEKIPPKEIRKFPYPYQEAGFLRVSLSITTEKEFGRFGEKLFDRKDSITRMSSHQKSNACKSSIRDEAFTLNVSEEGPQCDGL